MSLEEYASLLTEKDRAEIQADLERLKAQLPVADAVKLKEVFQRLEGSAYRIADAIYADQQKADA
jgi:molecular chaperone DnaK